MQCGQALDEKGKVVTSDREAKWTGLLLKSLLDQLFRVTLYPYQFNQYHI